MFFRYIYKNSGLNRLHSTDLTDMRQALVGEDDDGPDGGSPFGRSTKPQAHSKTVTLSNG